MDFLLIAPYFLAAVCVLLLIVCVYQLMLLRGKSADLEKAGRKIAAEDKELDRLRLELERRKTNFATLFDFMAEGVVFHRVVFDASNAPVDYVIEDINPAFTTITGLPREEVIGKTGLTLSCLPNPYFWDHFREVIETGEPVRFETYVDPVEVYFRFFVFRIDPEHFAAVMEDITSQKKVESALRRSEEKFRQLAENIAEGVSLIIDQHTVWVNKAFCGIFGYSIEEAMGMDVDRLIVPEQRERFHEVVDQCGWEEPSCKPCEFTALCREGAPISIVLYPRRFHFDGRKGYQVVVRDITEQKEREAALAAEKELLAVTLQSISDAVVTTDTDGNIVLMNYVAEELIGMTAEEAAGRAVDTVLTIELSKKASNRYQRKAVNEGILWAYDREKYIVETSSAPIRKSDGGELGKVIVFRDISEKQRLEEEFIKTERMESLSVLAGGIAHDFNNILTSILGNLSLAKAFIADRGQTIQRLENVEKACAEAKDLTAQLLTFSKGGAPVRKLTSLKELIVDSVTFVLGGSNVSGAFEIDENLWDAEVDRGQISQVIQNLILNADQAMPEGGSITVQAENITFEEEKDSSVPRSAEGHYVMITIKDEGVGIPHEYMTKIFDPFFTTKKRGNGLGLASCYAIIRKHDGHITVSSRPGVGTTFTVYLPAKPGRRAVEQKRDDTLVHGTGRILVMDDDSSIVEFLKVLLAQLGYDGVFVFEGREAVSLFERDWNEGRRFDAIILDMTIPGGMGGMETLKRLQKIDPNVKAIVSSGHSLEAERSSYFLEGFKGIVEKPYNPAQFSKVLYDVIHIQ